jgi:quercetin dioxygenase-like cupin family protein
MDANYVLISRLDSVIEQQKDSIVSKTVYVDDHVKAVLMALDTGQELSEHTASMPAIIHFLEGEADVTLGQDAHRLKTGAWVHMPANLTHSVCAISPTVFLLVLLKSAKQP